MSGNVIGCAGVGPYITGGPPLWRYDIAVDTVDCAA